MTCHEVRRVLLGRPMPLLNACGRPGPGEIRRHLEVCERCDSVRRSVDALETGLRQLAVPTPPSQTAGLVAARIEGELQPGERPAGAGTRYLRPAERREGWAWGVMAAGLAAVAGAAIQKVLTGESAGRLIDAVQNGIGVTIVGTASGLGARIDLILSAGLGLYLVGLFAASRGSRAGKAR